MSGYPSAGDVNPRVSKRPPPMSDQVRARVLELRRTHSLSRVAAITALPLGTVKTVCSRSGAFRDNLQHREFFTLAPIQISESTSVAVPELPPQQVITGDKEVDAVLWLHSVIKTGQADLIEKAMVAAARIKTPLPELEKRYTTHLATKNPGNFAAMFASMGFSDLETMGRRAVERMARQREARSRFGDGDGIYADTPAEQFCIDALRGVSHEKHAWDLGTKQVVSAFERRADLLPHTLLDCLHELSYWDSLSTLRYAFDSCAGDPRIEVRAREDFLFLRLAAIRARAPAEAVAVFRYLADAGRMDRTGVDEVLLNLIGGPAGRGGAHGR